MALVADLKRRIERDRGSDLALSVPDDRRPASLVEAVVRTAAGVFDAAAASIALLDEATGEAVFHAAWGAGAREIVGVRLARGQGIAGAVLLAGEPIVVPQCRSDSRFASQVAAGTGYVPVTLLVVPLRRGSEVFGVLSLLDRRDGTPYGADDVGRAELFGELAAIAVGPRPRRRSRGTRPSRAAATGRRASRSASVAGRPAARIAAAAPSMSYSARCHVADHDSRSSSSQAARGSPSRGWPTAPGLRIHCPSLMSSVLPSGRSAPEAGSSSERWKESATCEWPTSDTRRACASMQAEACRAERTYSQIGSRGEAWYSATAWSRSSGSYFWSVAMRLRADRRPGPANRLGRPVRELGDVERAEDREVVVADEHRRGARLDRLDAGVGLARRSRRGRRGTRSRRARFESMAASTASSACRLPCTSEITATRRGRCGRFI